MAISLGLVDGWAFRHTNCVCKNKRGLNILKPEVRIVFVARRFSAEITLCVIGCHDGLGITVVNCINANVASTYHCEKEKYHTEEIRDSSISERSVFDFCVNIIIVAFVARIGQTLLFLD